MKNVLIILGNPSKHSFSKKIVESYSKGAKSSGAEVKILELSKLNFDPVLHEGYNEEQKLEPDLVKAQKLILWADHLVFVYPVWWGSMPAILQGFIERTLLPGFAYTFKERSFPHFLPKGFLKGKTASIITTGSSPRIVYTLFGNPSIKALKYFVLMFCGIRKVHTTAFYSVKHSTPEERLNTLLKKVEHQGKIIS